MCNYAFICVASLQFPRRTRNSPGSAVPGSVPLTKGLTFKGARKVLQGSTHQRHILLRGWRKLWVTKVKGPHQLRCFQQDDVQPSGLPTILHVSNLCNKLVKQCVWLASNIGKPSFAYMNLGSVTFNTCSDAGMWHNQLNQLLHRVLPQLTHQSTAMLSHLERRQYDRFREETMLERALLCQKQVTTCSL